MHEDKERGLRKPPKECDLANEHSFRDFSIPEGVKALSANQGLKDPLEASATKGFPPNGATDAGRNLHGVQYLIYPLNIQGRVVLE